MRAMKLALAALALTVAAPAAAADAPATWDGLVQVKAKKLALVAAARKILLWAWAVYRQRAAFDPSRAAPALAPAAD